MLDFIGILLIFVLIFAEIALCVFCVKKICLLEKKVNEIHIKMLEKAVEILEINEKIKTVLLKINKLIRILNSKKFYRIKKIIITTIDTIQIFTLLKSLNLSKNMKSVNIKNIKKFIFAKTGQQIIKKLFNFFHNLCAI